MAQPDSSPDQDASRGPCEHSVSTHRHGLAEFEKLAQRAWSPERWRQKDPRRKGEVKRLRHMRWCARSEATQAKMVRVEDRLRHGFKSHRRDALRRRAEVAALTPYGAWAIPEYIVMCESGGDFRARNSASTAGGAYQILDSTWVSYGGTGYADSHPAAVAPPIEQHRIAGRIWTQGGSSQWSCA